MEERQRQYYLSQMGITTWYARAALPGAAPSQIFDFGFDSEEVSAPPEDSHTPEELLSDLRKTLPATPSKPAASSPLLEKKSSSEQLMSFDDKPKEAVPLPTTLVDETKELTGDFPDTLRVGVWRDSRFLYCSELSPELPIELQATLLNNLAHAVHGESVQMEDFIEVNWPPFGNHLLPGLDARGLMDVFSLLWAKIGCNDSPRTLVFMGATIDILIRNLPKERMRDIESFSIVCPSISEMLIDPLRKQEAWEILKKIVEVR